MYFFCVPQRLDAEDLGRSTGIYPGEHLPHPGQGHRSPGRLCVPPYLVLGRPGRALLSRRGTDRLINPSMRCSTWRGNDLTKLNRDKFMLKGPTGLL